MNLSQLTLPQLQQLRAKIAKELEKRQTGTKSDLLKRLKKMAKEHGLSLSEIVGVAAPAEKPEMPARQAAAAPKEPLPAKYRHPNNKDLAWSGRGRRPQWVDQWLTNGGALTALEVAAQKMGRKMPRNGRPSAAAPTAAAPQEQPTGEPVPTGA